MILNLTMLTRVVAFGFIKVCTVDLYLYAEPINWEPQPALYTFFSFKENIIVRPES